MQRRGKGTIQARPVRVGQSPAESGGSSTMVTAIMVVVSISAVAGIAGLVLGGINLYAINNPNFYESTSNCNDSNPCTQDLKNKETGACYNPPYPNDHSVDTDSDVCSNGNVSATCQFGVVVYDTLDGCFGQCNNTNSTCPDLIFDTHPTAIDCDNNKVCLWTWINVTYTTASSTNCAGSDFEQECLDLVATNETRVPCLTATTSCPYTGKMDCYIRYSCATYNTNT